MPQPTTLRLTGPLSERRSSVGLPWWLAPAIVALMAIAGAVLLGRRLAGALGQPLSEDTLAILGVLLAGAALASRWLWRQAPRDAAMRRATWLLFCCPTAVLMLVGVAVHVRGTSMAGTALFWSVVVLEEGASGLWIWQRRRRSRHTEGRAPAFEPPPTKHSLPVDSAAVSLLSDDVPGGQVTQQFVRSRSAQRGDVFSGWLRVEIPARGRSTNVHVAFCPPFARVPAIEVRQVDGPLGRIKTVQALPYGARLDFKLTQPSEQPTTVLLRFVASSTES